MLSARQLIRLAKAFADLGWSIQEQAVQAANMDFEDLNANAVREIVRWLRDAERLGVEDAGRLANELEDDFSNV